MAASLLCRRTLRTARIGAANPSRAQVPHSTRIYRDRGTDPGQERRSARRQRRRSAGSPCDAVAVWTYPRAPFMPQTPRIAATKPCGSGKRVATQNPHG
jgi:hypothetical protein